MFSLHFKGPPTALDAVASLPCAFKFWVSKRRERSLAGAHQGLRRTSKTHCKVYMKHETASTRYK